MPAQRKATPTFDAMSANVDGLPGQVVEDLLNTLGGNLVTFRAESAGLAESDLAVCWLAGFGEHRGVLAEERGYFMTAQGMLWFLEFLEECGPDARDDVLDSAVAGWPDYAGDLRKFRSGALPSLLAQEFREVGIAWPAAHSDEAYALFRTAEAIQNLRDLTGADLALMPGLHWVTLLACAAHALNSPDGFRSQLIGPEGGRSKATLRAVERASTPNEVLRVVVEQEKALQSDIVSAEQQLSTLKNQTKVVYASLRGRELTPEASRALESAGMSLHILIDHLEHQAEYERSGRMRKLMTSDATEAIAAECDRLVRYWRLRVDRARKDVAARRQERVAFLDSIRTAVERFAVGPACTIPARRWSPQEHVRDPHPDEFSRFPHALWLARPVVDRDWRIPVLSSGHVSVVLNTDREGLTYERACAAVQNIVITKMAVVPPRRLTLTWIDPIGRGQSAGPFLELLEVDKGLLGDQVWSEPNDVDAVLRRISERMSYLEQRCLKDTHADLDSYNRQAGSLAEPFHTVVVTGFPRGFSDEAVLRLRQVCEQGGRLGVTALVVLDADISRGRPLSLDSRHGYPKEFTSADAFWNQEQNVGLRVIGNQGHVYAQAEPGGTLIPAQVLDIQADTAHRIILGYATASTKAADVVVDSTSLLDDPVSADSSAGLDIGIGVHGRGSQVRLQLGKGLAQNVLVGGLPGSGKSSLFHTLITMAARAYPPTELEMYLLDFKQGVEFQPYAAGALPHARVVAVQSERAFGLSVLRALRDEIDRRASLFRGSQGGGADSLAEYRERTGAVLPRVLVVVDEFQVLFADDDTIAHECAQLLDHVVRQGRAFGVHTVLGTQTLRGHGAMGLLRGTLDQVALRIVLKTSETDSRLFLSDDNPAAARLTRPGEAVFNPDGGRPEGNLPFQVALTSDNDRDATVADARSVADTAGFTRRPMVFDGTREISVVEDVDVAGWCSSERTPDRKRIWLHVGLPVAIGGSGGVSFSRMGGRHLLIVLREDRMRLGAVLVALVTAVHSSATPPKVSIVECAGNDEDHAEDLRVLATWRNSVTWGRRRKALEPVLSEAAAEVRRRTEEDDYSAQPWIVVVNTLHRARELTGQSAYDESPGPDRDLRTILADGADVGVHLVIAADTVDTVDRRLGNDALNCFGARLLGQCSVDVSQRVLGSSEASRLGDAYALLDEPDDHRRDTVRPYPIPDQGWIAKVTTD